MNLMITTDLSIWANILVGKVLANIQVGKVDLKHLKFSDKNKCKYFAGQSQLR